MSFVPGASTLQRVADAFPATQRVTEAKALVHEAALAFDGVIERHVGDRATLELILDGMAGDQDRQLEVSRRLAFRGNSGLCGVQARTRLSLWMIAPNAKSPDRLDMITVRGYTRVRRLRGNVEWPILRTRHWNVGDRVQGDDQTPLDARSPASLPLLAEFCQGALPRIESRPTNDGLDLVVRAGPVGNSGAFDCFAGELLRAGASRYATPEDPHGEVGTIMTTPTESIVFDVLYHRDLKNVPEAEVLVLREPMPGGVPSPASSDPRVLPIKPRMVPIPGAPPAVATTLVPRYAEMVQYAMTHAGWKAEEFHGQRLEMAYPPFNSQIMMRFPLERR